MIDRCFFLCLWTADRKAWTAFKKWWSAAKTQRRRSCFPLTWQRDVKGAFALSVMAGKHGELGIWVLWSRRTASAALPDPSSSLFICSLNSTFMLTRKKICKSKHVQLTLVGYPESFWSKDFHLSVFFLPSERATEILFVYCLPPPHPTWLQAPRIHQSDGIN